MVPRRAQRRVILFFCPIRASSANQNSMRSGAIFYCRAISSTCLVRSRRRVRANFFKNIDRARSVHGDAGVPKASGSTAACVLADGADLIRDHGRPPSLIRSPERAFRIQSRDSGTADSLLCAPRPRYSPLNAAFGLVIEKCYNRHPAAEYRDFLKQIDGRVPKGFDVHIVMDNHATHTIRPRSKAG